MGILANIMAVRTYGYTTLFKMKSVRNQADPTRPFSLQVLDTLSASDFSGEQAVDMMFTGQTTTPVLWLVSKSGHLYRCRIQDERKYV